MIRDSKSDSKIQKGVTQLKILMKQNFLVIFVNFWKQRILSKAHA